MWIVVQPGAFARGAVAIIGAVRECVSRKRNEGSPVTRNCYFGPQADVVAGSANFASLFIGGPPIRTRALPAPAAA